MQNYALLEVAGKLGKPVLLKRGLSSSLDELLMAADYILKEGNERVMLCERGIRTFETATRFTLDLGAVPWLKLHTHLPVIVDPQPRVRRPAAGRAAVARGRRGRRRRDHRRGPRGPRGTRCATARRRSTRATSRLRPPRRRPRRAGRQDASPDDTPPMADPVVYFEIVGGDGQAQQDFYRELFGWDPKPVEPTDGGYARVSAAAAGLQGGVGAFPGRARAT